MFSMHHPIRRGGFTRRRRVQKDIRCKARAPYPVARDLLAPATPAP